MQLNSKVVNIIQCLHAQQLCTVFKSLYLQQLLCCLLPNAFLLVRTALLINSHLTQTFMCATRDIKTMLLDFFLSVYKQLPVY